MDYLLQLAPYILVNGVVLGVVYAVLALGWQLVFQTTRLLNFAFGEYVTLAALSFLSLRPLLGTPAAISAALALAVAAALATYRIYCLLPRGTTTQAPDPALAIPVALGLVIAAREAARLAWGPDPLPLGPLLSGSVPVIGAVRVSAQSVLIIVLSLASYLALGCWLSRSERGQSMLAVAQTARGAALTGIDVQRCGRLAFVLSGACGGLLGVMLAGHIPYSWASGTALGLKGLVAAILGGMTPWGGLFGGLLLGLAESAVAGFVGSALKEAIAMLLLVAIVFWRAAPRRQFA